MQRTKGSKAPHPGDPPGSFINGEDHVPREHRPGVASRCLLPSPPATYRRRMQAKADMIITSYCGSWQAMNVNKLSRSVDPPTIRPTEKSEIEIKVIVQIISMSNWKCHNLLSSYNGLRAVGPPNLFIPRDLSSMGKITNHKSTYQESPPVISFLHYPPLTTGGRKRKQTWY